MEFSTFDVVPKRKRINVFKLGKLWLFKISSTTESSSRHYWTITTRICTGSSSNPLARETTPSSSWSGTASTTT